jgi:hypothetical protein
VKAIEVGLLTLGSSYSPTPSQRVPRSWLILLAFVPDHSGASVRDLHPLPSSSTSIAATAHIDIQLASGATDVKLIVAAHRSEYLGEAMRCLRSYHQPSR